MITSALSFAVLPREVAEGLSFVRLSEQGRDGHFTKRDMVTHFLS